METYLSDPDMINEPLNLGNESNEVPLTSSTFLSPFFDFNP